MERPDDELRWRKASKSAGNGGGCVEIADRAGNVHVRDTTARHRGMLTVNTDTFAALLTSIKRGELDLP
jgi:hypothetical protein